ncbi:pseudouridine-5'-phosphate glycosidase, partial [Saccharomonospora iraqiensis]|uniref:pseudouridine-5'-phosphate glycosidase n=1 Tax=Saccharomonospora iraqiensis TaxID=52698 RepID=UPI00022E00B0
MNPQHDPTPIPAPEVADALDAGVPVLALESTLLAHGLPPGRNLEVARRLERTVRDAGAVP